MFIIRSFLLISMFVLLIPLVFAEKDMVPSYSITIVNYGSYTVDPKEPFSLETFISGYGEIRASKIIIYFGNVAELKEMFICNELVEEGLDKPGDAIMTYVPPLNLFYTINNANPLILRSEVGCSEGKTPLKFNFEVLEQNFREEKIVGDYKMDFIFTYTNNGKEWYTSKENVIIHVRSGWERNQWWIITIGVVIAFLALFKKFLRQSWKRLKNLYYRLKRKNDGESFKI